MFSDESTILQYIKNTNNISEIDKKKFYYKNKFGYNILHLAIEQNDYLLVKKILNIILYYPELSFLRDDKTTRKETPLKLAERKKCTRIINLLKPKNEVINVNTPNYSLNNNEKLLNSAIPKGLNNIHGSCYLNTVLQCLFHIKPLSFYFLEEKSKFYENSFAKAYLSVIFGLIDTGYSFEPLEFKNALIEKNPDYNSFGCDPKDVIIDFLYFMNQELLNDESSFQLNNKINKCNKDELFQYNKDEVENTKTIVSELFGGFKQISRVCSCNGITFDFIFEFFLTFNLQKICKNTNTFYYLNIKDCFKDYYKDEINIFTCQKCFKKNKGLVKNRICVLPKYLIIILDRGKGDKFNCSIDFDYTLDLNEVTEQIENPKCNTEYELIGSTFLLGSSGGGHTFAYCKHFNGLYYLFDDNNVYNKVSLNDLKKHRVFLLFYERKKND